MAAVTPNLFRTRGDTIPVAAGLLPTKVEQPSIVFNLPVGLWKTHELESRVRECGWHPKMDWLDDSLSLPDSDRFRPHPNSPALGLRVVGLGGARRRRGPDTLVVARSPGEDIRRIARDRFHVTFILWRVFLGSDEEATLLNFPSRNRVPLKVSGYCESCGVPIFVVAREVESTAGVSSRAES
jgi:hypothetical protein